MKRDLRIVTWNCNRAFRRKIDQLAAFNADILVIQECENPEVTDDLIYKSWAKNYFWVGDKPGMGLGIFAREDLKIRNLGWSTEGSKYFIAINVAEEFQLIAVWNQQSDSYDFRYIGQFWKYLQLHKPKISDCVILGDFNSNTIWDKRGRVCNHSNVVAELNAMGIASLYHEKTREEQGRESEPTFFLQRNPLKNYHIDYLFASASILRQLTEFKIGAKEEWLLHSDHMPLFACFRFPGSDVNE